MGFLEDYFAGKVPNNLEVTVLKPNGEGLPGASVSVTGPSGESLTASLFQKQNPTTDQYGKVGYFKFLVFPQSLGVCTFVVTCPGYLPYTFLTEPDFDSTGLFTVELIPGFIPTEGYYIVPAPDYVSALAPIVYSVTIPNGADIDRIVTIVESSKGKVSIIETEFFTDETIDIDIRSAIHLSVLPVVVPDNIDYCEDREFSDNVFVSFHAEKGETSTPITFNISGSGVQNFNINVANFRPTDYENSLSSYANQYPRKWISKRDRIPVGYYADIMLWFTSNDIQDIKFRQRQISVKDEVLTSYEVSLSPSFCVQRLKLITTPVQGAEYLEVVVYSPSTGYLLESLKIKYQYGY